MSPCKPWGPAGLPLPLLKVVKLWGSFTLGSRSWEANVEAEFTPGRGGR